MKNSAQEEWIKIYGWDPEETGECEHYDCKPVKPGKRGPIMTAYCWDGSGDDPNKPPIFCEEHMQDWVEDWKDQWSDYYSGLF